MFASCEVCRFGNHRVRVQSAKVAGVVAARATIDEVDTARVGLSAQRTVITSAAVPARQNRTGSSSRGTLSMVGRLWSSTRWAFSDIAFGGVIARRPRRFCRHHKRRDNIENWW